ncbi:MAG TPA: hypothetical protein VK909_15420, partial [Anaerolineales bacterium]|nr:hypothetical protein [Anaerolineales bacterium]
MDQKRIYIAAGFAALVVLLIYGWFVSIGPWRARGYTSDYYTQMASAFQHGQLALEAKPDPALLNLPNLYDPKARKYIPLLGDASVYKGRYYLYFGPLPSLLLIPFSLILGAKPGDQVFVYIFILGLFFIQSLFFLELFRRYFSGLPFWFLPLIILLLGLTGPFMRMLSHPFIHEAAISGGQFFASTGLYIALLALQETSINDRKLFWVGVLWACALATRITQLVPVGLMVLVTVLFIWKEGRKEKAAWLSLRPIIALTMPLLIGGVLLAWYNWARFDSIIEFGLYYQLAAFDLQANYDALFSRVYVVQNIYNYFFQPFALKGLFPFVFALPGSEEPIFLSHELPKLYTVEGRFAGLLISTPFIFFSVLPGIALLPGWINALKGNKNQDLSILWTWITGSLIGSSIGGAIPTLLIFYVAFRYETEFITGLTMLAVIGFYQVYRLLQSRTARIVLLFIGTVLILFSVYVNIALAYTG